MTSWIVRDFYQIRCTERNQMEHKSWSYLRVLKDKYYRGVLEVASGFWGLGFMFRILQNMTERPCWSNTNSFLAAFSILLIPLYAGLLQLIVKLKRAAGSWKLNNCCSTKVSSWRNTSESIPRIVVWCGFYMEDESISLTDWLFDSMCINWALLFLKLKNCCSTWFFHGIGTSESSKEFDSVCINCNPVFGFYCHNVLGLHPMHHQSRKTESTYFLIKSS